MTDDPKTPPDATEPPTGVGDGLGVGDGDGVGDGVGVGDGGGVPVPSTPYRSPPVAPQFSEARASRLAILWGPALTLFGVVLWSFVVMGQLVTTFSPGKHDLLLGEVTGWFFVFAASVGAWVVALRQSFHVSPAVGFAKRVQRGLAFGILAVLGWGAAMILAVMVGRSASDGAITVVLMLVASGSFLYGRRVWVESRGPRQEGRSNVLAVALWAGAGLLTFAALIALGGD
jgi:hypothetical protein